MVCTMLALSWPRVTCASDPSTGPVVQVDQGKVSYVCGGNFEQEEQLLG